MQSTNINEDIFTWKFVNKSSFESWFESLKLIKCGFTNQMNLLNKLKNWQGEPSSTIPSFWFSTIMWLRLINEKWNTVQKLAQMLSNKIGSFVIWNQRWLFLRFWRALSFYCIPHCHWTSKEARKLKKLSKARLRCDTEFKLTTLQYCHWLIVRLSSIQKKKKRTSDIITSGMALDRDEIRSLRCYSHGPFYVRVSLSTKTL